MMNLEWRLLHGASMSATCACLVVEGAEVADVQVNPIECKDGYMWYVHWIMDVGDGTVAYSSRELIKVTDIPDLESLKRYIEMKYMTGAVE